MGDTDILPARVQNVLDMEIIRLNLWSIKFNAANIKLEGYVRSEDGNMMQKICSEIICKRMNATMLFDVSGRFYELSGQIDREFQAKMGMPGRVIDEFVNGFPENWAYHINSCLTVGQRSALRPIQSAPREPIRSRAEPIVTLADETELVENERKNSEAEKEKKRNERDEQRARENERNQEAQRERERKEALAAAERKRRKDEEDRAEVERKRREEEEAANYTFRVPESQPGEPITPIRFKRGNGGNSGHIKPIFKKTPVRGKSNGPLASSTPQAPPPQQPRILSSLERGKKTEPDAPKSPIAERPVQKPMRQTEYADDADLFAVPKLPPIRNNRPSAAAPELGFDFLDQMDSLFDTVVIDQTPNRNRMPRRAASSSMEERSSPPRDRDRYEDRESTRYSQRHGDDYNMSRLSRRDATFRRNDGGRDESRMSRKRGYYGSPDEFDHRRRDDRDRRGDYYEPDYKYDMKRSRPRENSSSSGRSVRFEDVRFGDYRRHREDSREPKYSRNQREYDDNRGGRGSSGEDDRKLNDILRRENELMARLQNHRPSSSRRDAYSSDEDDLANEWDRENQEILDDSMMFGDGLPKKARRSGGGKAGRPPKKQPTRNPPPKPARKPEPRKKARRSPVAADELNDSIASHRPRRACATPSTPAPKRITWPKRDLDKLKHVIQLKNPTAADADWAEVARLLAKDGVDPEVVKQTAISKLKWKEPVQEQEKKEEEEEEERKRRRGAAAKIKEGVRMHEEMRKGRREEDTQMSADSMEDYQPEDVAADQSLLALGTPLVAKKKGGTRGSIMPKPVEDSPITRGRSSTVNSPRLDQTKVKEVETTLRYVQHLSNMQARPSSRANTSTVSKSGRGSKNTSMSLEQGARKAMKIINRGRTIDEEDEDEESNEEEEDHSEDEAYDY